MALTLTQLVDAVDKYAHLDGPKAVAALDRNLTLLRGRVGPLEKVVAILADAEPLSDKPGVAIHQILAAIGHPVEFGPNGESLALNPASVIADASPDQIRQLALLGFFGQPGSHDVDYSLFERYYETDGQGNWAPKDPTTSAWAAYQQGE